MANFIPPANGASLGSYFCVKNSKISFFGSKYNFAWELDGVCINRSWLLCLIWLTLLWPCSNQCTCDGFPSSVDLPGKPETNSTASKRSSLALTILWTRCFVLADSIPGPNNAHRAENSGSKNERVVKILGIKCRSNFSNSDLPLCLIRSCLR